jgi:hypothetical protein
MKRHISAICGLLAFYAPLQAQSATKIGFETQDYKSIGVYDTWEHSPFRSAGGASPLLEGHVQVVENADTLYDKVLKTRPDSTSKVLAVQRSRYGSNTFGVRIDLKETFELTPQVKYVHAMIHKPKAGRCMLIGLGKRKDRPGQSTETEQFWVFSSNEVGTGQWVDAVFSIKGAGNIDIYSLVVVPDCEDPNGMTEDFVAYVDNIEINSNPLTTTNRDDYPMNYDKSQKYTRTDRGLKGISLGSQTVTPYSDITSSTPVYTHLAKQEFLAKAGQRLNASVNYKGTWMNAYVYIDYNNDGRFTPQVQGGKIVPNSGNELCSYSFLSATEANENTGFNSAGETKAAGNRDTRALPSFVLPDTLKTGYYRMRYKVDWNCADAGGNITAGNNILKNGGGVIDIRLNIHGDTVAINHSALNGEVVSGDGKKLNQLKVPFGQPFKVKMLPADGFEFTGLKVRHGYNLAGDSISHGTYQYIDELITRDQFAADSTVTIPASMIDGDVLLEGVFVDARNTVTYEVYFEDKIAVSKTVYGAQRGEIVIPEDLKREFCTYTCEQSEISQLPATIRIVSAWNGPVSLSNGTDTTWYQIKVSSNSKWVVYKNATPNVQFSATFNATTGLWAFSGNPYDGFTIFNKVNPAMVLASASPRTDSNTGANTHAVLESAGNLQSGHTALWTLLKSTYANGAGFYICNPEGYGLNYRAEGNLAYWTTGKDGGSTFVPTAYATATAISLPAADRPDGGHTYDISGRTVGENFKGIAIRNGKKILVR